MFLDNQPILSMSLAPVRDRGSRPFTNHNIQKQAHHDRSGHWKQQQDNWPMEDGQELIDKVETI